jgi:hypothetical protein
VTVLAHGIGGRADLPVPLTLALYGAGLAVAVSFLALVVLWRRPRLQGAAAGRPLPSAVERVVDGPVLRPVLQLVVLGSLCSWWSSRCSVRSAPTTTSHRTSST